MTEIEEKIEETKETPLKGRAGVLAKFKKSKPDLTGEPTEDELWNFAGEDYAGLKDSYKKMESGQKGLYDYIAKDPRFGAAIGMSFGEGDDKIPFMQALGRLYGQEAFEDSEDFLKGVEEFNQRYNSSVAEQKKAQENFENLTVPRLEQFAKENGLTDEQVGEIGSGLMALAEGMLMGDIPIEAIDLIYKGLNYEKDVQEAIDTGAVQAKNERIDPELRKLSQTSNAIDTGSSTASTQKRPTPKRRRSFYDEIKEETV